MPKRLKFVVEQWVLFMVWRQMWQERRFKIFESALHFWIELGCLIQIRIASRSFAGPFVQMKTAVNCSVVHYVLLCYINQFLRIIPVTLTVVYNRNMSH